MTRALPISASGPAPPESSEAQAAATDLSPKENQQQDCPAGIGGGASNQDAERQRVSAHDERVHRVLARAGAGGWIAHVVGPGMLLLSRWGRCVEVSIEDAEALLARQGGDDGC